jgi:hypothetical protein
MISFCQREPVARLASSLAKVLKFRPSRSKNFGRFISYVGRVGTAASGKTIAQMLPASLPWCRVAGHSKQAQSLARKITQPNRRWLSYQTGIFTGKRSFNLLTHGDENSADADKRGHMQNVRHRRLHFSTFELCFNGSLVITQHSNSSGKFTCMQAVAVNHAIRQYVHQLTTERIYLGEK